MSQTTRARWCGLWAERPAVVPQGVSHSTPSRGQVNPTLEELKALLGTTLIVEETTSALRAAWMSPNGEHVRLVGHPDATVTLAVLDLFAARTESDLGLPVNRFWRGEPNCPE